MSEGSSEAETEKPSPPARTQWHRLLAKLLELLLTPVGITVQSEVPITSDPPKVDILLLRRNGNHWTEEQLYLLCDGLRDSKAGHLLVEFKYSESLNASAILQALSYDYFYRQSQQLGDNNVQTFVMVASTPRLKVLDLFGYSESGWSGIYQSKQPLLNRVQLIVLNQLRQSLHNAFVQTFASKRRIRKQAFAQLDSIRGESMETGLLELVAGLRSQYEVREGVMKVAELSGEITPELLMKLGREFRRAVAQNLTVDELAAIPPEKRLAGLAPEERLAGLAPEERLAGLAPEQRLAGLAPEEMEQIVEKVPPEKRLAGLAPAEMEKLLVQIEAFLQQQRTSGK